MPKNDNCKCKLDPPAVPTHVSSGSLGPKLALTGVVESLPSSKPGKYVLPKRPPDESAKYCRLHGCKQVRRMETVGPVPDLLCVGIMSKSPRNSHWSIWTWTSLTKRFVTPIKGEWFVIVCSVECPECQNSHREKVYRRLFGRVGLALFKWKARWFPEFYSFVHFDPKKPLKDHFTR